MRAGCIVLRHALMRWRNEHGDMKADVNWTNFAPSVEAFQEMQREDFCLFDAAKTMFGSKTKT
jgi:hypothetical protein